MRSEGRTCRLPKCEAPQFPCGIARRSARLPDHDAVPAKDRILFRQRHPGNARDGTIMLGRVATADVVVAPFGIGADDKEIVARPLAFVARAGRQDRDVAGGERKHLALLAAETDARLAGRNAEHLVRIAVTMMIIEDAISPAVAPAIRREFCFKIL